MEEHTVIETVSIPSPDRDLAQALSYSRAPGRARPILMVLQPWPDARTKMVEDACVRRCDERGWHCVFPGIREMAFAADTPELVLADIQNAYDWTMEHLSVDSRRIFLCGESGGAFVALIAAGNLPSLWTAVSAWSGAVDLPRWHRECSSRGLPQAAELEAICGGIPGSSPEADARYHAWSPVSSLWRAHIVPVDVTAGIHDTTVSPVHAIRAFNELVKGSGREKNLIPEDVVGQVEREERVPGGFERRTLDDPSYGRRIHLRRTNALARLTLFEGGEEGMLPDAMFAWFECF